MYELARGGKHAVPGGGALPGNGVIPDGSHLADDTAGECHFMKTHQALPESNIRRGHFHRAVILHRDLQDNFEATLRFLDGSPKLNASNCSVASWHDSPSDFQAIEEFHRISHNRYYCHWQNDVQSIPKYFINYEAMRANPKATFEKMFAFVGYSNANVSAGLGDDPVHQDDHSTAEVQKTYQPLSDEVCATNFWEQYQAIQNEHQDKCWWGPVKSLYQHVVGVGFHKL